MTQFSVQWILSLIRLSQNWGQVHRDFKYPKEEGYAQALYYREARDLIRTFHKASHDPQWLTRQAGKLRTLGIAAGGASATRLNHNARALAEYARHFSSRKFDILRDIVISITRSDVVVKISPDLHVRERSQEKVIKLEFAVKEPGDQVIKIICQAMLEGASENGYSLPPSSVLYLDVPRGTAHKGARAGARMRGEIEAACQNITALWERL